MSKSNFSEDFKRDAVRQITERGYPVAEVSQRLGVSQHSQYEWKKKFAASNAKGNDEAEEIRRLKKELARVTEKRDILKKRPRISRGMQIDSQAFVALHRLQFSVRTMCRILLLHPSGFYTWLKNPLSGRANEDRRQTDLLLKAWGRERQGLRLSQAS